MSAVEQAGTSGLHRFAKLGKKMDYSYLHVMPDKLARLHNLSQVCRICAAITDKLHNLFHKDGLKHELVDKIHKYLPIKVEKDDQLPQSICANCREALLAWDALGQQARLADLVLRRRLRTLPPDQRRPAEQCVPGPSADAGTTSRDGKFADAATDPRSPCPERVCGSCPLTLPARESDAHVADDRAHLVMRCKECHSYLDKRDLIFHMNRHPAGAPTTGVEAVVRDYVPRDEGQRRETLVAFRQRVVELLGENTESAENVENGNRNETKESINGEPSDDDDILCFMRKDQTVCNVDLEIARMADSIRTIEDIERVLAEVSQLARELSESESRLERAENNGNMDRKDENRADAPAERTRPPSRDPAASKRPKRARKDFVKGAKQKEPAENSSEPASPARADDERSHDGDDEADAARSPPHAARARRKPADKSPKAARTCPICGKEYRASSSYFYHMKYFHKRSREHECEACGKKFGTRANLAQHASIHTGACELACKECGKRFRSKASLYIHEQSHGGVKRWACGQCSRSFRWRTHLARHTQRHAAARAHVCGACGRGFSVRCDLLRHARTHAADEFHCEECGLKFAQKRYLKVHVLKKHAAAAPPAPAPAPAPAPPTRS